MTSRQNQCHYQFARIGARRGDTACNRLITKRLVKMTTEFIIRVQETKDKNVRDDFHTLLIGATFTETFRTFALAVGATAFIYDCWINRRPLEDVNHTSSGFGIPPRRTELTGRHVVDGVFTLPVLYEFARFYVMIGVIYGSYMSTRAIARSTSARLNTAYAGVLRLIDEQHRRVTLGHFDNIRDQAYQSYIASMRPPGTNGPDDLGGILFLQARAEFESAANTR